GIYHSSTPFYRRMQMLMDRRHPLSTGCSRSWRIFSCLACLALLSLSAAVIGIGPALAQDRPQAPAGDVQPSAPPGPAVRTRSEVPILSKIPFLGALFTVEDPPAAATVQPEETAKLQAERDALLDKLQEAEAELQRAIADLRRQQQIAEQAQARVKEYQALGLELRSRLGEGAAPPGAADGSARQPAS